MRTSFLLLLCVVLLATTAFANKAESDAASVYKQAEKSENDEVHRVKRGWRRRRRRGWRVRWRRKKTSVTKPYAGVPDDSGSVNRACVR
ncbi:hypothetical protein LSAT2_010682 [Lamellibrachia satsuma]|nr:hypothetical protein LSAT2_010682 [Lamellibrachia satsuma]